MPSASPTTPSPTLPGALTLDGVQQTGDYNSAALRFPLYVPNQDTDVTIECTVCNETGQCSAPAVLQIIDNIGNVICEDSNNDILTCPDLSIGHYEVFMSANNPGAVPMSGDFVISAVGVTDAPTRSPSA